MSERTITYHFTAEDAKAVDVHMRQVRLQKKVGATAEASGKKQEKAHTRSQKGAKAHLAQLSKLKGLLAGGVIGAGGGRFAASMNEHMDRQHAATAQYEKDITGLLSLGDNLDNIQNIKNEVIELSNVLDLGTQPVADFLFRLQSGTDGLDASTVRELRTEAIELSRVTGDDLPTSLQALVKAYRNYGDEVGSVDLLQNKLFATAERGNITFGEMASLLPDVLPAAKLSGRTFDEVGASIIVATQSLGKSEKTLTGIRNIYLRLSEAQEHGIDTSGDLVSVLEQLGTLDKDTLVKIFGIEAIGPVKVLIDNIDLLMTNIEKLQGMKVGDDGVSRALDKRATDEGFRLTSATSRNSRATNNEMKNERFGRIANEFALSRRGARELMPGAPEWLTKLVGTLDAGVMLGGQALFTPLVETVTGQEVPRVLSDMQQLGAQSDINDLFSLGDSKELQRAATNEYGGYGNFKPDFSGIAVDRGAGDGSGERAATAAEESLEVQREANGLLREIASQVGASSPSALVPVGVSGVGGGFE